MRTIETQSEHCPFLALFRNTGYHADRRVFVNIDKLGNLAPNKFSNRESNYKLRTGGLSLYIKLRVRWLADWWVYFLQEKRGQYHLKNTLQTSQVSRLSLYLIHPVASLTTSNIAMMFEHIYGVASFIVMLIVLLCVFKMYLALTATCREHRAFLLESSTKDEQERINRGQREIEADRRSNAEEEERPRRFERRRLPVQHDERRSLG